jgi:serine/threonine protein kinase/WD40 repeat protein
VNAERNREEEIFDIARSLSTPGEREAYLAQACGDDAGLRQRIEDMLGADAAAGEFFKTSEVASPAATPAQVGIAVSLEKAGDRIGRYKLLQQIGEGGMGVVYMAEQEEPVRRLVALKIIKLGMDTRQVVARFEAERQALAMMDHPNIAKVLDAGATESGRPYFVMELVRGVPITEYGDKNCLPTRERLDLFIQVCRAVQHAHQKGVIHRDLKPSNILVTLNDGVPWPMIIDFGIAKATNQRLTEKTLFTHFAQMIGTPAYMSPEQAEMSRLDVDTRTDIYALGVLLYELLTGTTPFPTKELLSLGYREMQRTILEKEPLRPSTRLSTMAHEERSVVAKQRSQEASALEKLFRGDLDWIAMKCLEKDRTRRYETANGLAMDIQRHLDNEPVLARPPSQWYRLQKTYRRHRLAFASATFVVGAVFIALIAVALAARRENHARVRESAQRHIAEQERRRAEINEHAAKAAEMQAVEQRERAEASEKAAYQRTYASDMNLAQQALAESDLGRSKRLLNEYADKDLRGWEWRYLWQQTQSDALATLFTMPGWTYCARSSADGSWLAFMDSTTALIHVWDRTKATTVAKLQGIDVGSAWPVFGPVTSLLAYQGQLESDTDSHGILLWDARAGRKVLELPTGTVRGFGFSRDEKFVVTCSHDLGVVRWELPGGRLVSSNSFANFAPASQFEVTGEGDRVVLANYEGDYTMMDLRTGKELWRHRKILKENGAIGLSADDRILAVGSGSSGGPIVLYETATGRELGRLEGHRNAVRAMAFWPDGTRLASASYDQTIRVWDIQNPAHVPPPRILRGHKQGVWGLTLLPGSNHLVSACKDGEVCLWDASSDRRPTQSGEHSLSNMTAWAFSPDNRSIFAVDLAARDLVEWSWTNGAEQRSPLAFSPGADSACWSSDGSSLAVGATNGSVQVWELPSKTLMTQFSIGTNAVAPLQFHYRERQLAVIVAQENSPPLLEVWGTGPAQRFVSRSLPRDLQPALEENLRNFSSLMSRDLSQTLVRTHSGADPKDRRALLWSPADNRLVDLGRCDEVMVGGVAFSPNGQLVAVTGFSGWTWVWDTRTGRSVAKLAAFLNAAAGVTFSPDGKRLVVGGGADQVCRIWDTGTWRELISLSANVSWFDELRFSPDGNLIGARTPEGLHYWRAPSWEEIAKAP